MDSEAWCEQISQRLHSIRHITSSFSELGCGLLSHLRMAAVLLPLSLSEQGPEVLLTQRSMTLSSHAGEVALPGGMRDPSDADEVETALREAAEEVSLLPTDIRVLGILPVRLSKHDVLVVPVVAWIPSNLQLRADPDEVALMFRLPLERFLLDRNHSSWTYQHKGESDFIFFHSFFDDLHLSYTGDVALPVKTLEDECTDSEKSCPTNSSNMELLQVNTWGMTAGILIEAAAFILQKPTEFDFSPLQPLSPDKPFQQTLRLFKIVQEKASETSKL